MPWPADLPAPPSSWVPLSSDPPKPYTHHFSLDVRYRDALWRLLRATEEKVTAVGFNGHKWIVYPNLRFRGQGTVDRARQRCGPEGYAPRRVEED